MADRNIAYADLWKIYKESDRYKDQIEHWIDLKKNLPNLSWKTQLEVLDNCPDWIIKAHAHLLKPEAKRKLGLAPKQENKKLAFFWE